MAMSEYDLIRRFHARADIPVTLTVPTTGSAYATGQKIGSGYLTIDSVAGTAGANEEAGLSAILQSVVVADPDGQSSAIDVFFFNAAPTGNYADKGSVTLNLADLRACIGKIVIGSADYAAFNSNSLAAANAETSLGRVLKPASGTALYAIVICRGTPTYTAGSLYFRFQFSHGI